MVPRRGTIMRFAHACMRKAHDQKLCPLLVGYAPFDNPGDEGQSGSGSSYEPYPPFDNPGDEGQSGSGSSYEPSSPLRRTDSTSDLENLMDLEQLRILEKRNSELLDRIADSDLRRRIAEADLLKKEKQLQYAEKEKAREQKSDLIK